MGVFNTDLVDFPLHVGDARGFNFEVSLKLLDQPLIVLYEGGVFHEVSKLEDPSLLLLSDILSELIFQGFLWGEVSPRVQIVETCKLSLKKLDYKGLTVKKYTIGAEAENLSLGLEELIFLVVESSVPVDELRPVDRDVSC